MAVTVAAAAGLYVLFAYFVLPALWTHHEHQPGLAHQPMVTTTAAGIPGDALNVGLVGSQEEAIRALATAGWYPADAVTLKTSIEIAGSVLFDWPYRDAPVSPLFYQDRKQDFAFEKPAGRSADRRHHVRFWKILAKGEEGRPVWLGAATFDRGAGLSSYTGAITHRIAPDIDVERNFLMGELAAARMLSVLYHVSGIGPTLLGRNGGGDPYNTDGEITVGVLTANAEPAAKPATVLPDSPFVAAKAALWARARQILGAQPETE